MAEDRNPNLSAEALDSQMVPSAVMVSQSVGYDGGKKIQGRKRLPLIDTIEILISVRVVAASVPGARGIQATPANDSR
ncbi:MAG: hypothetical protein RLZZ597_940 [Cyanobacteriota bacterium]|jgi:putative transposase